MTLVCRNPPILGLSPNYIDADVLEWTGIRPDTIVDGDIMVDCMRRWPESIEGELNFVCFPYIVVKDYI